MKIYVLGFLILFSILFVNLTSNNILTYAEENKTNNIVIKDADLIIEEYLSGLNLPVMIDFIGEHMLVVEKDEGTIKIIKNGVLISEPILQLEVSNASEEGLIGILVQNNDVFVHHTTRSIDDGTISNWFTKYTWNGEKLIEPVELLSFHKGTGIHNAGVMIEDENGMVFGAIGDLGYGKILDMQQEKNFLSEENNYVGSISSLNTPSEVYAVGIRNTYGLDIDPVTGIIWDTENGHNSFDEVNAVQKKFNSGWNVIQGPSTNKQEIPDIDEYEYSDPEFSWERPIGITAIHFIESPLFPEYHDSVLIGSFHDGILYKFELNERRDGFIFFDERLRDSVLNKNDNPNEIIFGTGFGGITDIKEGPDGLIYIVSIGDGKIYRLSPTFDQKEQESNCMDFLNSDKLSDCNFSGMDLKNKDFSNKDLKFSDFTNTNLKNVNFKGSNLVGINFENAELLDNDFSNANLDSSIFKKTIVKNNIFTQASLIAANFQNSHLNKNNFDDSNLERTIFTNAKINQSEFNNSNLYKAEILNAEIEYVNFKKSDMTHTNFEGSSIKKINLDEARLWKTNFNETKIEYSKFTKTDIYSSGFKYANLDGIDFKSSKLSQVDFTNSILNNVDLSGIYPIESVFDNTEFYNSKINTCLEHDILSRILNKILRSIDDLDSSFLGQMIIGICN